MPTPVDIVRGRTELPVPPKYRAVRVGSGFVAGTAQSHDKPATPSRFHTTYLIGDRRVGEAGTSSGHEQVLNFHRATDGTPLDTSVVTASEPLFIHVIAYGAGAGPVTLALGPQRFDLSDSTRTIVLPAADLGLLGIPHPTDTASKGTDNFPTLHSRGTQSLWDFQNGQGRFAPQAS